MREKKLGFQDLVEENAEALGVSEKMLESINASLRSKWVSSMEDSVKMAGQNNNDQKVSLKDLLVDEETTASDSVLDYKTLVEFVKRGLSKLSTRERNIILLRYDVIQAVARKEDE